jgi:hypothetical protein
MVQRFRTLEQLGAWLESNARRSLLARSTSLFPKRTRSPLVGSQKKTKVSNRAAIRELTHTDIFPRTWLRDVVRLMLKL